MSSHIRNRVGISIATFAGVALLACFIAPRAHADSWDKMTRLTFSEPTQVMNTYLEPGTYMFKLANSDRHIVQIFNSDRSHLINTIFAIPAYQVFPADNTVVTYWETPPGTAKAVRKWFYPGDNYGQEFTYPTQLRQIAFVTPAALPAPPPAVVAAPPEPEAAPPAPEPQAEVQPAPAPESQQEVVIAQNTPPPAPAPVVQEPVPQPAQEQPQALPKTASPYPLIGLSGLLSLGLYLGLRMKQVRQ
jgi:hypothetical protein